MRKQILVVVLLIIFSSTVSANFDKVVPLPTSATTKMDDLQEIIYKDVNNDSLPDLFFSYFGSRDREGCIHYYQSNQKGFNQGQTIYCVNNKGNQWGVKAFEVTDINNDGIQDLIIGTDADYVGLMYGNLSKNPPFNEPYNLPTKPENEADLVVVGYSSSQKLMDIFSMGEEICSVGSCLYQFKANSSKQSGYNDYLELSGVKENHELHWMTGGYINQDKMIDLVTSKRKNGVMSIYIWFSNGDSYDNPVKITELNNMMLAIPRGIVLTSENKTVRELNGDKIPDIIFTAQNSTKLEGYIYLLISNSSEQDFYNDEILIDTIKLTGNSTDIYNRLEHIYLDDWNKDGLIDFYTTNYNEHKKSKLWLFYGDKSGYFKKGIEVKVNLINKTKGVILTDVNNDGINELIGVRQFYGIKSESPTYLYKRNLLKETIMKIIKIIKSLASVV